MKSRKITLSLLKLSLILTFVTPSFSDENTETFDHYREEMESRYNRADAKKGTGREVFKENGSQIEQLLSQIKQIQQQIKGISSETDSFYQRITKNDADLIEEEKRLSAVIDDIIKMFTNRDNFAHTDAVLKFVSPEKKNAFNEALDDLMPFLEKYNDALNLQEKSLVSLARIQARFSDINGGNELSALESQYAERVQAYKQLKSEIGNTQNNRLSQMKDGYQHSTAQLESLRTENAQLERDISDLKLSSENAKKELENDKVNRRESKVLGATNIELLSEQDMNALRQLLQKNKKDEQDKQKQLLNVSEKISALTLELEKQGKENILADHSDLTKILQEINRLQTKIASFETVKTSLSKKEEEFRKSTEEKGESLNGMKTELMTKYRKLIGLIDDVPVSLDPKTEFSEEEKIMRKAQEDFPSDSDTLNDNGLSSSRSTSEYSDSGRDSDNRSFDDKILLDDEEKRPSQEDSSEVTVDKKRVQNVNDFIEDMHRLRAQNGFDFKRNPKASYDRCIKAIDVALQSDRKDRDMLINFLKNNKAFMGITKIDLKTGAFNANVSNNTWKQLMDTQQNEDLKLTEKICGR